MNKRFPNRLIAALLAPAAVALVLAGCGGGVPADSVAKVGNMLVKKSDYTHWVKVAAAGNAQQSGGSAADATIPDPPDYKQCIAQKRKQTPKPKKGQPKVTDKQLKTQCEQEYTQLRQSVMQFLISADWIIGEAKEMKVSATDTEVNKQFAQTEKQSFPKNTDKAFKKFLEQSGQTKADILYRVRLDVLSNKIREKITKGKDKVTQAQIASYYQKNKSRFGQPERRDVRVVLTKKEGQAQTARQALQSGQSWKDVAKQYSTDTSSKDKGGLLTGVTKGSQEPALDKAVFSAKKGKLVGPVKTQFGFYDLMVTKVTPGSQQSLKQATPTIKQLLISQNEQQALQKFVTDYQKKWKDKTDCRKGYVTQQCSNAPKPKTTTTPTTTAPTSTTPTTTTSTAPSGTATTGGGSKSKGAGGKGGKK